METSGSDPSAVPGEASQVAPWAIIETPTPSYEWTPVAEATKYRLLVYDTNETAIIEEWYTAEEAGCASKGGLCIVEPDVEVIGENAWKVLTCVNEECGSWSGPMNFDFPGVSNDDRFNDNPGRAGVVIDNNTKLMWMINARHIPFVMQLWDDAVGLCPSATHAGYDNWRMPVTYELRSLLDYNQQGPALPMGHPFLDVQMTPYWAYPGRTSAAPRASFAASVWTGLFYDTPALPVKIPILSFVANVWCVRDQAGDDR